MLDGCAGLAAEHDVVLRLDGDGAPARVRVAPELAERTLHPLVENACRHAMHEVRIALRRSGGEVLLEVVNDGPGVPAGDEERIFQPGVRGTTHGDAGVGGSAGLGLALARRLARTAGGDVEAHAGPGGRFLVRLPAG